MADLYFQKKIQLNNTIKKDEIVNIGLEIEKKRSCSPLPTSRPLECPTTKKIVYKQDLEDLKNDLSLSTRDKFDSIVSQIDSLRVALDNLNKSVDSINKILDVSKLDSLKSNFNDAITKMNANVNNLADQIVSQLTKSNELESRIVQIETLL